MARIACIYTPECAGQETRASLHDAHAALCTAVWESVGPAEPAPPDACFLDLRHLPPALQTDEAHAAHVLRTVIRQRGGLTSQIGIGGGKFSARIAAQLVRDDGEYIIAPGDDAAVLAPLPAHILPMPPEVLHRLKLFGIRTVGEFAALPRGPLQAQFGAEGTRLWRLAAGYDDEPVLPSAPAIEPTARIEFPAPIASRAAIERAAVVLLRQLFRHAEIGNRHARRLRIQLALEDRGNWERTIAFHTPAGTPDTALAALRPRLNSLDLPAPAHALTLSLLDLCGERGLQPSLLSAHVQRLTHLDAALQQLHARLGEALVLRMVAVEPFSRLPERRAALVEWTP